MHDWLTALASVSLLVAVLCALVIACDIVARYRQRMWIMNLVWPLTALYAGPLALWAYSRIGRRSAHPRGGKAGEGQNDHQPKPFPQTVGLSTTHCGSGCTLGDITAESLLILFPMTLFGRSLYAAWAIDFAAAFLFGIAFQYFTITPMRQLSPFQGLVAALKADALSLTAWQIGMYAWMAFVVFVFFGHELNKSEPVFWFMMQIAMLLGFLTSYPVNWWLVRADIKEEM